MTVASNASRIQYNCDGITKTFAFTFNAASSSEVQVILTDSSDVETVLVETTDYTVSETNNDFTNGGTVTTDSTYASGNTITILRNVTVDQDSDFYEGSPTLYGTFEEALDHLSRVDQQLNEKLSRAALLPKSAAQSNLALPLPEASKYLGWNASATALENKTIIQGAVSGTVTLTANAATTTVNNTSVTANSLIFLFPVTANAAADFGSATSMYISAKVAATSFTIAHPNNANADKTFNYLLLN